MNLPSKDSSLSRALERASCTLSVSDFQASVKGQLGQDCSVFHRYRVFMFHIVQQHLCLIQIPPKRPYPTFVVASNLYEIEQALTVSVADKCELNNGK